MEMIEITQRRNFYNVNYLKVLGINKILEITVKPNKYINYMKDLDISLLSVAKNFSNTVVFVTEFCYFIVLVLEFYTWLQYIFILFT